MREWIVGRHPVYEVLRAGRRHIFRLLISDKVAETGRIADILKSSREKQLNVERVPRRVLDPHGPRHQGVALETSDYPYSDLTTILDLAAKSGEPLFILLLDTLQDPQNLGTLLRTAESTGVHGVVIPLRHAATVTPAVVIASSGASEHLLIAQANLAQSIAALKEAGAWVVGLESGAGALPPEQVDLDGPIVLVVGSEGEGMRSLVRDSCDFLLRLPMRGNLDSLNAAVAGSIALYMIWQKRGFPGRLEA